MSWAEFAAPLLCEHNYRHTSEGSAHAQTEQGKEPDLEVPYIAGCNAFRGPRAVVVHAHDTKVAIAAVLYLFALRSHHSANLAV